MALALEKSEVAHAVGSLDDDVAAVSTVAAVGTALWHELLPAEAHTAMATAASLYLYFCAIVKQGTYPVSLNKKGHLPAA